jgi:hypothetical protein
MLAKKSFFKVQNGGELILADFKSQNINFFDDNYNEFSNVIILMETMLKTQRILRNPNTKVAFLKVHRIWSIPNGNFPF